MFIVIEGTDSSGKSTQTQLLIKKLEETGQQVEKLDFPAYETPFGEMVARYLRGEFGGMNEVLPEVAVLLFAVDRYQFKDLLFEKLKKGKVLIANRYLESNLGYHGARFDGFKKHDFVKWSKQVESRLPQADIMVFLDMPPEAAEQLMQGRKEKYYLKGKKKDILEESKSYQEKVRDTYLEIGAEENWLVIKCAEKNDNEWRIKSIEEIHEEIWSHIQPMINWHNQKPEKDIKRKSL